MEKTIVNLTKQPKPMLKTYPTPVNSNEIIYFNHQVNVTLYDLQGQKIIHQNNTTTLNLPNIACGTYLLKTNKGDTQKIMISQRR